MMKEGLNNDDENAVSKKNVFEDFLGSFFAARFTAPVVAILGMILAYQITIAPYIQKTNEVKARNLRKIVQ